MDDILREIHVEKVSDKIVNQLENLIKEGKLVPGNKLPSERQLIDMLGVGRSSLREALNKLETMGYIEIKKRKGIFIKSINSTLQLDPLKKIMKDDQTKIMQLYDIRSDIEQSSASAAALNRSEKDLSDIVQSLNGFTSQNGESLFSWELDKAFHLAIARASHNFFRVHVTMNIFDFSQEFIMPLMESFTVDSENFSIIIQQHSSIVKAIREKDAMSAREKMKEHLDWTNQQLIEYFR